MGNDRYQEILDELAHEIWAVAQLAPGEGIVDGAARVETLLREALAALEAENEMLREQLHLATVDQATAEAEANDARAEVEALRAEVERLQEIVRPKREDECLTLDHWRMRAHALEANWSRCSHACAVEQDKREQAEARAERLAEALQELEEREQRDEALLRQALEALERGTMDTLRGRNAAADIRERLGESPRAREGEQQ